jgi:hypothetical protein
MVDDINKVSWTEPKWSRMRPIFSSVTLIRIGLLTGVIVAPLAWCLTREYADLNLSLVKITLVSIAVGPLALGCAQLPMFILQFLIPRTVDIDQKGIVLGRAGLKSLFPFPELATVSVTRMDHERHVLEFHHATGCRRIGIREGVDISALQRLLQSGLQEAIAVTEVA